MSDIMVTTYSYRAVCITAQNELYDQYVLNAQSEDQARRWLENSFRLMRCDNRIVSIKMTGEQRQSVIELYGVWLYA